MSGNVSIDDFTVSAEDWPHDYGHQYVWRTTDVPMPKIHDGQDGAGSILVCLDIDGTIDVVYADLHQSGDVPAIERAIAVLEQLRDGLTTAYQGRGWPGRCFAQGHYGRCKEMHAHDGEHGFPTEEEHESLRVVRSAG